MINVERLVNIFKKNDISFFSGVPDSVLKDLSIYFQNKKKIKHVLAVNEGSAISLGIGYHLATKKIPCIYMQNSGLSNAINPIISLAHQKVYSIPLLLMVGWRGSPKSNDEPQHKAKGEITLKLLKLLNIKYVILRNDKDLEKLSKLIKYSKKKNSITACVIENGILKSKLKKKNLIDTYKLDKELFFKNLLKNLKENHLIISSTGFNSRELFYYRKKFNCYKGKDFYLVGGMGHTSSVSLGINFIKKKKKIICLDGDGSFLMHMGSLNTVSHYANKNLKYILINNNSHDSVGGQKTFSDKINFRYLVKSFGFNSYTLIKDKKNLNSKIQKFLNNNKKSFLEVKISNNKVKNLPRPKNLKEIKFHIMDN